MYVDNSSSSMFTESIEKLPRSDLANPAEKRSGLRCLYTNTDFLQNKLNLIELFVTQHDIDVIALTETLNKFESVEDQANVNFIIPGYTNYQNNYGRGVCVFIKNTFSVTQLTDCEKLFTPSVYCKVSTKDNENFLLGVVYRSPNCSHEENEQLLKQINHVSEMASTQQSKLLLVGDFNHKNIDWESECSNCADENKFLSCFHKNYLSQFVASPTHKRPNQNPTLIDLVIANDPGFILDLQHHAPFGASHHEVLTFVLDIDVKVQTFKQSVKQILEKED